MLNLVLYKAVNGSRIYATSAFEMYCVQLKEYVFCKNMRVDLSGDKESNCLIVCVTKCQLLTRWDRIRSARFDSGRILCLSFRPGSGPGIKNLGKTGLGVTFQFRQ